MRSRGLVLTSRSLLAFILVSYAVVISIFVDAGQRNYLVLFAAIVGGICFLLLRLSFQRQAFWALWLFAFMSMISLFQGNEKQLWSIALTFVYSMGYFAIVGLLDRVEDKRTFLMKVMRGIIYAFGALSLVQFAAFSAGLPIPNDIVSKGQGSYNALAYEPSQLGRVVGASMLCYLILSRLPGEPERARTRGILLIAFVASMILSGSSLALASMISVYALSRSLPWLIFLVIVGIILWPLFFLIEFEPLTRFLLLLSSLGSLDVNQVLAADHSGGVRAAPLLIYLRDSSTMELGFWLGYGSSGLDRFFLGQIAGVADNFQVAGFLPGFAVMYGSLAFVFFIWIFVFGRANRTTLPLIAFWAIFMTSSAWNAQVFWFGLVVIHLAGEASRDLVHSSGRTAR